MTFKRYALLGLVAPGWFLFFYLILSSIRPGYSFLTKAISELGSIDAPHKWWWNISGYIIPGIMVSIFSIGLYECVSPNGKNKFPLIGIFGSGVFMSFAGIFPADMENRQSLTSLLHYVGSFGSYIFFLIGAFTFPKQMRRSVYWTTAVKPALLFAWLTILFGAWPFIFPHMPGAGQRFVFFFYFLWIFYTAWQLYKSAPSPTAIE
jgi:hypothetical membrane protein